MSSSSLNPNKKRRLDSRINCEAGSSKEVLHVEGKSSLPTTSKSANENLLLRRKENSKSNFSSTPLPSFCSASKLIQPSSRLSRRLRSRKSDVNASTSSSSVQEDETSNLKIDYHEKTFANSYKPKKSEFSFAKGRSKAYQKKFTSNVANKILNYFKPLPSVIKNVKKVELSEAASYNPDVPSTSKTAQINETFFQKAHHYYGLFGESDVEDEQGPKIDYFERLPEHVLESIFCQIPFKDLMKCRQVSRTWNNAINNKKFMEWKKMYYGTKYERPYYCNQFIVLRNPYGMIKAEDCFPILINFMADRFCRKPASDMSILLAANPLACLADAVVTERFPELQSKDTRPWCVFAVAMIISESVWDVYQLYRCLFTEKAETSIHDVTDAMYCVATFLLYFKNGVGLNHGLHYRVYHALYMIENNLPSEPLKKSLKIMKGLPGQQSIHSYSESAAKTHLTYEQLRILNHRFHSKQIVKIVALAGTGKTTTLLHFARLYPQVRYLNVMYNKAICEEAKSSFPPNVKCKTAHSLAYKVYGSMLKHKLVTRIRPHDLVTVLKYHASSTIQVHSYAKLVLYTLESFTFSADDEITKSHVPFQHRDVDKRLISELDREKVFKDAVEIWKKMINKNDTSVKITHDVYLKLYQLSKPKLSEYHCIMVDEAQDCNPAMLDVVLSQKLPVILVGDPNQQIYGFRGASNALQSVPATHTYYLTKSFRFGPEIAYIASCCLEVLKLNSHETLVGSEKKSYTDGRVMGQYAIISRTNVQLFNEAVRICCLQSRKKYEPTVIHGAFAGGIKGYGFDQIVDIYNLRANSRTHSKFPVKDKFISRFKTFADLNNYAKNADDPDLLAKIELINVHDYKIVDYIRIINEKCSHPIELASIVFSTAHKAKGLEFDTVSLTDDYQIGKVPVDINNPAWSEETSVLYVALTRAKKSLLLPEKLLKVLHVAQEKFEHPVSSKSVLQSQPSLKCINCQEEFVPHTTLVLKRRQTLLSSNRLIKGGPLCMKCGTEPSTRPEIRVEMVVMYLDRTNDFHHQSMSSLIGPLPGDPPINRSVEVFNDMDIVYVINVNV